MAKKKGKKQEERSNLPVILIALGVLAVVAIALFVLLSGQGIKARTLTDLTLRSGPGVGYSAIGSLPAGTEVRVIGRNEDGSWLLVKTDIGKGWISGLAEYLEVDQAAVMGLPVVEAEGPPYDVNNENVRRVLNQIPLVVHHPDRHTCASHAGLNNLLPDVKSGNIIGPHSGDFVHVELGNVLLEYSNGTFRFIRENPIARFPNDEKYMSLGEGLKMFETGEIVWTGSFGEWPARGVTGCDESAAP
jgi:uncharacterized protein YraI